MGVDYLGGSGLALFILAKTYEIISWLFSDMVTVYGNIDSHGLYCIYDDVVVLVSQCEAAKMTFVCGVVVGANLLHLIQRIKRKLQHWGKK